MTASIKTSQLSKFYAGSKSPALDSLSIEIQAGEVYGYLGANGAGKTTTLRLLMGFLLPSSGSAQVMGQGIRQDSVAIKQDIGYLSGDIALYERATGQELLDFLSHFQTVGSYRQKLEKRFNAELDKPIGTLSKGNRQKLGIIQAFMHQPSVLILDEPTSGLDPLMQEAFYDTVMESKKRGAAVLMSSHNLAEAQRICDRVGIIKHGKLIQEQSIEALNNLKSVLFRVVFAKPVDGKSLSALKLITQENSRTALLQPTGSIEAALKSLSSHKITELSTKHVDLEDEFLEFYGDST